MSLRQAVAAGRNTAIQPPVRCGVNRSERGFARFDCRKPLAERVPYVDAGSGFTSRAILFGIR